MVQKTTKVGKNPPRKGTSNSDKTSQATVQAISTSCIAEFETHSESEQESDREELDIDVLLNTENNNE